MERPGAGIPNPDGHPPARAGLLPKLMWVTDAASAGEPQGIAKIAAAVRGGYSLAEIRAEPELAGLRSDPRYQKIVGDSASGGVSSPGKQN